MRLWIATQPIDDEQLKQHAAKRRNQHHQIPLMSPHNESTHNHFSNS
uniref:Uncharacterized protein n=1 Tax=Serratia phage Spe5P4 TaxID=3159438 RepID=A0AAU7VI31_9CAUD